MPPGGSLKFRSVDQDVVAVAFAQILGLDDDIAQARPRRNDDFRHARHQLLRLLQHLLILRDTRAAFGLPGARGGGDPFGFGGERALPSAFFLLLLLQALALLLQPRGVIALERIAPPALQFEHPAGDVVQEVAVMGHDHHGAGVIVQRVLQPGDAFRVQMVGRLVQQQQVGLFQQQLAQRDPPLLAARQRR